MLALTRLASGARTAAPVVWRGLDRGTKATGRGVRALGRGAHRHRVVLAAIGHRLAWWSALGLLVLGGRPILGLGTLPDRTGALAPFAAGLLLCAVVRLLAAPRRLRVAALGLGALHGTALVLVWTAFAG